MAGEPETDAVYNRRDFVARLDTASTVLIELIKQKNIAYGNSYKAVPAIMRILYPGGITDSQLDDALLVVRILDKLKRIAVSGDQLGEDPWQDIAGYALLKITTRPEGSSK